MRMARLLVIVQSTMTRPRVGRATRTSLFCAIIDSRKHGTLAGGLKTQPQPLTEILENCAIWQRQTHSRINDRPAYAATIPAKGIVSSELSGSVRPIRESTTGPHTLPQTPQGGGNWHRGVFWSLLNSGGWFVFWMIFDRKERDDSLTCHLDGTGYQD